VRARVVATDGVDLVAEPVPPEPQTVADAPVLARSRG
jgi:hypothetical protein